MRTFAQKQNQPQKPASSSLVKANMTTPGQDQNKDPFLHLQRTTSGNRGGQQMLQANAEERKTGLNAPVSLSLDMILAGFLAIPLQQECYRRND
jgi:hypothetical protein